MTKGTERPTATRIRESKVRIQEPVFAVKLQSRVFHVNVIDAIREHANELYGVDPLPEQVRRIEVEPNAG